MCDLWQVEGLYQKHRHLVAGYSILWAVIAAAASGGDAFSRQLLNPIFGEVTGGIAKGRADVWRRVRSAIFSLQEEDRYRIAGDGIFEAIQSSRATAGDAFSSGFL